MTVSLSLLGALLGAAFVSMFELPDYQTYRSMFDVTPALNDILFREASNAHVYGEFGYTFFVSMFKCISQDFFYFRFFSVFIALYLKLYFIFRVAHAPSIAVVAYFALFFYMDSFLLRQSLAAGIIAIALLNLVRKKHLHYALLICIAAMFHVSALILLPLVFLLRFELSKKQALGLLVIIFVLGFIGVGKYLGLLIEHGWLPSYISSKLFRYSINNSGEATGLLRGAVLLYTCGMLCYIIVKEKIKMHFEHYNIFLWGSLYGFLFLVGFNDFGIFGDRIFRLFGVAYAVIFSASIASFTYSQRAYLVLPISFLFVIISMLLIPTGRVLWL